MQPTNCFTRDVMDHAVVETYADRSRRVVFGDIALGRKLQPPGPKCPEGEHTLVTDNYQGVRKVYVDDVCTVCSRRIPVA